MPQFFLSRSFCSRFCISWIALLLISAHSYAQHVVDAPSVILPGVPFSVSVDYLGEGEAPSDYEVRIGTETFTPVLEDGQLVVNDLIFDRGGSVSVELISAGSVVASDTTRSIPGWLSIVPPLLAIVVALLFKRVIPALFLGIWFGAWIAVDFSLFGFGKGLFDSFQIYVRDALNDGDHASIILFTMMVGGMVGIISKNGGTKGIVNGVVKWANTAQRGQIATWVLGLIIFFDDYANTLVVGKTMRPVTDKLKISREKLAYIVDSTAAPVASLALATTWIGYEVGLIGTAIDKIDAITESAYSIFLSSLAYSFYPILALFFVFLIAYSRRDFGPMLTAERRARASDQVSSGSIDDLVDGPHDSTEPIPGKPQRAFNALIPVGVLIVTVMIGLFVSGEGDNFRDIIGSADSYKSLMWGSLAGVLAAVILSLGQRILTLEQTMESWFAGLREMLFALIILVLAWALSDVTEVLHTADYLVSILGDSLPPGIIPALIFFISAATGFATGSSWGAMGILMPLVVPLTWAVLQANGIADPSHYYIIYSTVSCVLAGAVWGDHCSPISDTTILSSMASSCDHIEHVRTQLPYALLVGIVAILIGTIPTGFGFPWWISMIVGAALLVGALWFFGKETGEEAFELAD